MKKLIPSGTTKPKPSQPKKTPKRDTPKTPVRRDTPPRRPEPKIAPNVPPSGDPIGF